MLLALAPQRTAKGPVRTAEYFTQELLILSQAYIYTS